MCEEVRLPYKPHSNTYVLSFTQARTTDRFSLLMVFLVERAGRAWGHGPGRGPLDFGDKSTACHRPATGGKTVAKASTTQFNTQRSVILNFKRQRPRPRCGCNLVIHHVNDPSLFKTTLLNNNKSTATAASSALINIYVFDHGY